MTLSIDIEFSVIRNDIDIDLKISGDVDFNSENHGHPDLRHPSEGSVEITECLFDNEEWDGELTNKETKEVNFIIWQQFKEEIEEGKIDV